MNKFQRLFLLLTFTAMASVYAQQSFFDEFRKKARDCAALYVNHMETGYSPKQYVNHPYWNTDEFQKGDICYNGFLYGDLQLRYDTYKKHLVVITPEKQIAVCVDMRKVDYFVIQGTLFVRRDDDFMAFLYESPHLQLYQKVSCVLGTPVEKERVNYQKFKSKTSFIFYKEGVAHTITSYSGLMKYFPGYKKLLKAYAKEQGLSRIDRREKALVMLLDYADTLINNGHD